MPQKHLVYSLFAATLLMLTTACSKSETTAAPDPAIEAAVAEKATSDGPTPGVDYQSAANTGDYRTRNIDLDLTVDFERKVLEGTATLTIERERGTSAPLILDTRDLDIEGVQAGLPGALADVPFALGETDAIIGTPLEISLPADATTIEVSYRTSPGATGLQWLEPRQTAGKRHPFLFSQAQPHHARSYIPLQDTPGVRTTYNATLRVPTELRAVMSANNTPEKSADGVYTFTMPQPIPSYLIALAVGDLEFTPMGERTGVYAEAEILAAAAAEFADTEAMLEATEARYGPYQWDRYDLLILPPSFPFGGMENPRLSFITPTVIAGDKSLVSLIAHELAHSWSGNLVTNSTWRDLWLNEGFTTYLTNRIMQFIYGDERYRMEAALGYRGLVAEMTDMPKSAQVLALDVRGIDPDDAFSGIPYSKGALFLFEMEQKVGREDFDAFLLDYFNTFEFQSLTTEDFMRHLQGTLLTTHADQLDEARIREWIYSPGLPEGAPAPQSDAFSKIDPLRTAWFDGELAASDIDTADWTYHQWKYFLEGMPESLSAAQMAELDEAFDLTASTNNEIAFSWLMIAIRNDYAPADARLENFLMTIGRNKFLRPLYTTLVENGEQETAARIFEAAKPGYHPLTVKRNSQIIYGDDS